MSSRSRWTVAAGLLALMLVAGACSSDSSAGNETSTPDSGATADDATTNVAPVPDRAPTGDAFYRGPDPRPRQAPGTLVWSSAIDAPPGARAWKVLYHSESLRGKDIVVSGVVVVPDGSKPAAGRPVVTYAHGTTGTADRCAPSKLPTAASNIPDVEDWIRAGYVVTATDYEGLGTPGLHPYLVGASEGRSVLDIVRAAGQLGGAASSNHVVIFGHSQGGHAALWAGQIAPSYAPELRIDGVVAAAPAADLKTLYGVAASVPAYAGYVVMAGEGFAAAIPGLSMSDVLTPRAIPEARRAVDTMCSDALIAKFATGPSVVATDPMSIPKWAAAIEANVPGSDPTPAPTLVVQGGADALVPSALNRKYVQEHCTAGGGYEYREYPGASHTGVLSASEADVVAWVAARVAGARFTADCSVPTG